MKVKVDITYVVYVPNNDCGFQHVHNEDCCINNCDFIRLVKRALSKVDVWISSSFLETKLSIHTCDGGV